MFPMEEVVLHGLAEVIVRAPRLFARIRQTAAAIVAADPDIVVLIDCPGFNLRVAKRVRRLNPAIPIVDYVSPTVWAYFPGRARRMAPSIDHLLAVLPFEPAVHRALGGPPTTYVGHPLIERLVELRPARGERKPLAAGERPVLLVLPGSRRSEINRLMDRFGETVARVTERFGPVEVVLPAVTHLAGEIRARAAAWPVKPTIVEGEAAARAAFRRAHAALAASGTVTLELALSGVPMVVAYRVDPLIRPFKWMLRAPSIVLPNLIAGSNAVPEMLDGDARPEKLAAALIPLLTASPERARQLAAFQQVEAAMTLDSGTPSKRAADIVLGAMRRQPAIAGPV
jgi:lipid-A-disaccharide synthase